MVKFKTIKSLAEGQYKEKGSKFLAFAYAVENEDQCKVHLEEIRKMHHKARHVCYAFRCGMDNVIERTNDDGEPSGTAGRPILGQIHSHELHNILVAVVRYFGGTKLGVSGLIRAYKRSAADALNNSQKVSMIVVWHIALTIPYEKVNDLLQFTGSKKIHIASQEYSGEQGTFHLYLPAERVLELTIKLKALVWSKYEDEVIEMDWPINVRMVQIGKKAIIE